MTPKKIEIIEFDDKFNQTKKEQYQFPITRKQFSIRNIFLNNDGSLYLLVTKFSSTNINEDIKNKRYNHLIYKLENGIPHKLVDIPTSGHHLRQIDFRITKNKMLIVTGFYSDRDMYGIKGIFYHKFNLVSKEVLINEFRPFEEEFFIKSLDKYSAVKASKKFAKGKLEDPYFILENIIEFENGDIALVAEQIHTYSVYGVTTYYHLDLAIIRIDKNGKILWASKIAKENSKTSSPIYSHNTSFKKFNEVFLIYNGNVANINHTQGEIVQAFGEGAALIMLKIDSTGNYQRQILKNEVFMNGLRVRPGLSKWIDKKSLILFSQNTSNVKSQSFFKLILTDFE